MGAPVAPRTLRSWCRRSTTSIGAGRGPVVLERGATRVELALDPFGLTIRRAGRRLMRSAGLWAADGTVARPLHPVHRGRGRPRGADARAARLPGRGARQLRRRRRLGAGARRRPARAAASRTAGGPRRPARVRGRGRAAAARAGLGPALRRASRRAGRAALHVAGPDRTGRPARRRSPLHRTRLPARDARRRRHPPGRLRAGPVAAVQPGLRGLGPDRRQRHPLRPGGRTPVDLYSIGRRPAARDAAVRAHGRRSAAAVLPSDRLSRAAAGVGLWLLEEPRRVRAPGRRARGLPTASAEHRIPLDAIVLDSPWATQYNTWQFNPHQFPDARGDGGRVARRRGTHGRVGDAVGQPGFARRSGRPSA